jgi:uncharacterized protein involved in exopolysaccharide biosynthesis
MKDLMLTLAVGFLAGALLGALVAFIRESRSEKRFKKTVQSYAAQTGENA